jgi:leucine-rich repeat protein|uniref:E3 ubiquitin-protein ligase n=1 Tax=Podoviridae sp. ctz6O13 TaxID=2827757 RepID=A0A8S5TKP0_9CAUD|nr:MAG TPA: E3 ubiquitin-protein ligase [Podoviridae sp. ctz6O13]
MKKKEHIHDGDIILKNGSDVSILKEGMVINGHLILDAAPPVRLPNNMTILGSLKILRTEVVKDFWPEHIHVKGNLTIQDSNVQYLPSNLGTVKNLVCFNIPLQCLPDKLVIQEDLNLNGTNIQSLPEGVTCGRNITIIHSHLSKLPSNLHVHGRLNVAHNMLTSLPDGMVVGGDLHISNNPLNTLSEGLVVNGSLVMHDTLVKRIHSRVRVSGDWVCNDSPIEHISSKVQMLHAVNLDNTLVSELHTAGEGLSIANTGITSLPYGTKFLKFLNASGSALKELPDNLVIEGDLDLSRTPIDSLPYNLVVGNCLSLEGSLVTYIPSNLIVSNTLLVSGEEEIQFPKKVQVGFQVCDNAKGMDCQVEKVAEHALMSNKKDRFIYVNPKLFKVLEELKDHYRCVTLDGRPAYTYHDGKGLFAIGSTLLEAKIKWDSMFDTKKESEYESLTLDSRVTLREAFQCFYAVTFEDVAVDELLKTRFSKYDDNETLTIRQFMEGMKGQPGIKAFVSFFKKKEARAARP